jgi:virulence-associated protein VagC
MMQQMIVNTDTLQLPSELRTKIGTEQVLIRETGDGFLLVPFYEQTKKIRGMLKGSGFSTERFFEQKRADKEAEA